jgi:hypothetical protein
VDQSVRVRIQRRRRGYLQRVLGEELAEPIHLGSRCDRKGCTLFAMTPKTTARPGRNEPCHCGSGRKYKLCCLEKDNAALTAANAKVGAEAAARPAEAVRPAAKRRTKHQTEQPWKASTSHVFVPRPRGPRKVGGS